MPENNLSDFIADVSELKALVALLQPKNKSLFIIEIERLEKWIKANTANKKLMRSAKNKIERIRSEMEKYR